jgi:hypothetical protein
MPKTINLFLKRPGFYSCFITTQDEIDFPYDRKITLEVHEAKEWKDGTYVGDAGSAKVYNLNKGDNNHYCYVNVGWDSLHKDDDFLFKEISRELISEKITELSERDMQNGIYLFTKEI